MTLPARSWIRRWRWVPERVASASQWLEIVLLPLLAVALAWLWRPADPTLSQLPFPWLWLAPVLVALRYGVLPGLLSSVVLIAHEALAFQWGRVPGELSVATLFGSAILVLLCGEFSDVWRDKNLRMQEAYLYVNERLSRLTKRHLLLNLSHDRLEQEMLARPGSLRDALLRLRQLTATAPTPDQPLPGAQGLLQLLSQYVNIEAAELYLLHPMAGNYTLGASMARVGEPTPLQANDELLTLALQNASLVHIASQDAGLQRQSTQLVVAPLVAGDDQLIAVLSVTRMPFFSLNHENLQMMLVLLGYYADNLGDAPEVDRVLARVPTMPHLFAQELARMMRMHQRIGMPSHLVVMRFEGPQGSEMAEDFLRIKRGLDLYWQVLELPLPVLVVLMPFASAAAAEGLEQRVEQWLSERYKGDLVSLQVHMRQIGIDAPDLLDVLARKVSTPA